MMYCQVKNGEIITVYNSPQDPTDKPGYVELPGTSPEAVAWKTKQDAKEANYPIYAKIAMLEDSITNRMWREDAVASAAIMDFGPGDARSGKTATQYIAFVNDSIAALRGTL